MAASGAFARRRAHDDADLRYMRSLAAAVVQRSPRHVMTVLVVFALFLATGIAWMNYTEIDVVVRADGKVVPSLQLQVLQSLEGGVVSEILVGEGDLVDATQPLVKISDIAFASSFDENRLKYLELRSKIARLEAEASGAESVEPDEEVLAEKPELMDSARKLFQSNRRQIAESIEILQEQIHQQENELVEANAKRRQLERSLALQREELELKAPLVQRGLVSRVDYLQLQQRENEIKGELEAVELSVPRLRSAVAETRRKIEQIRLDFQAKARRELNETLAEASRISEAQVALRDRVQRTTLRAPVKGTVKRLHVNTVGGVVSPGEPILEIVPFEDALLIEARVEPADVANIQVGMPARLKFSAYDFAVYGSLEGEVRFLSADTITNEEGDSYYLVRIRPERDYFGLDRQPLPIRVGMTSEADIITDKKSILEYLMKPINRGLRRALREQ